MNYKYNEPVLKKIKTEVKTLIYVTKTTAANLGNS